MKKKILLITIFFILLIGVFLLIRLKNNFNTDFPYSKIELLGNEIIDLPFGDNYTEPGYTATDRKGRDITDKVIVEENIDIKKIGQYEVSYKIIDSKGNITKKIRKVNVIASNKFEYKDEYDKIDNTVHGWGTNNKKNGQRPNTDLSTTELAKYNAYAMGPDEKVIYLTFDEGSLVTYLPQIVDILNKNDVKATFFLCNKYMASNATLIKEMVNKGHSIGNHTANHMSMPTLANKNRFSKYLDEIILNEETYKSITGKEMERLYREPRGEYSFRSLSIIKDLGYKTYFWSSAYQDWDNNLTEEQALKAMLDRVHNGAIYLFHPNSKGNYLALDSFIKQLKERGYTFDLVKNIS